jgi:hypothetical protein
VQGAIRRDGYRVVDAMGGKLTETSMPDMLQHNLEVIADESFDPGEPRERHGRDRLYDDRDVDENKWEWDEQGK